MYSAQDFGADLRTLVLKTSLFVKREKLLVQIATARGLTVVDWVDDKAKCGTVVVQNDERVCGGVFGASGRAFFCAEGSGCMVYSEGRIGRGRTVCGGAA